MIHSIECNLGIICGCLPGIKPLLVSLFPAVFGSSQNNSKAYSQSHKHPQAFAFQTLSGAGDGASTRAAAAETYIGDSEGDGESVYTIPERGIRVGHAITVRVEAKGVVKGGEVMSGDAGSEERIIA